MNKRNNPSATQITEEENRGEEPFRPLEDPYLVGEAAAAEARRDRMARETGEDILIKEDQQWDWLLSKNTPKTIPAQSEQSLTRIRSYHERLGPPRQDVGEISTRPSPWTSGAIPSLKAIKGPEAALVRPEGNPMTRNVIGRVD